MAMFDDLFPKRPGATGAWGANPAPPAAPVAAPTAAAEPQLPWAARAAQRLRGGMTNVIGGLAATVAPVTGAVSDFTSEYWKGVGSPASTPAPAPAESPAAVPVTTGPAAPTSDYNTMMVPGSVSAGAASSIANLAGQRAVVAQDRYLNPNLPASRWETPPPGVGYASRGAWTNADERLPANYPRGAMTVEVRTPQGPGAQVGPNIQTPGLDRETSAALSAARQAAGARGDWDAVKGSYQANGGTWMGRTAADDADAGWQAQLAAAYAKIGSAKTVPGQKAAIDAFNILMTADTARQTNKATTAVARAGHQLASQDRQDKILNDLLIHGPAGEKSAVETQAIQGRIDAANRARIAGASESEIAGILAGRPISDKFGAIPSVTGNDVITYDRSGKTAPKIQTPSRPVTDANILAWMRDNPRASRADAIAAHRAKGMDVSGLK